MLVLQNQSHYGYVAFVKIEDPERPTMLGTYLTAKDLKTLRNGYAGGCGTLTTMHRTIAETYASNPGFYGATYCVGCMMHLPVREFIWDDGSDQTVGS
jgi:hypothetical protein